MHEEIKEIALRDPEAIKQQIDSLEKEVLPDTASAKKTYAGNIIRLDIANLQRDVNILAIGVAELAENITEIRNTLIVMESCLASNVKILAGLISDKKNG